MAFKKKGMLGAAKAIIVTLLFCAISLPLGLLVKSKFMASIDRTGFSAAENTTYANVGTNIGTGFDISSLLPLMAVGLMFIGYIAGAMGA
jgi:hypothetical protein